MKLSRFAAEHFRRFEHFEIEPHPRLSVFKGENASGKTSILEAAFFGARAASFRAQRLREMVSEGKPSASVSLSYSSERDVPAVRWRTSIISDTVSVYRLEQTASRRALVEASPVILVDRHLHRLIEEGPVFRRRYLDWGLFYVEPSFMPLWHHHERVLRQRNLALRLQRPAKEITVWNTQFVLTAEALQQLRARHVEALQRALVNWIAILMPDQQLRLSLHAGWNEQIGLEQALAEGFEGDRKMGFTHAGPSRAELRIRLGSRDARPFASRGQQKLLGVAMSLAQASLVLATTQKAPMILLDDLEAELSLEWQMRLLNTLKTYVGQSLVTSLEWRAQVFSQSISPAEYALFHVEHGRVVPA